MDGTELQDEIPILPTIHVKSSQTTIPRVQISTIIHTQCGWTFCNFTVT